MRYFHFAFATASLALLLSGSARADVPPPDTLDCRAAKEGDPCSPDGQAADGGTKPGSCRKSTCTKLDYSRDGAASVEYECLKCVLGSDGGSSTGGAAGTTGGASGSTGGTTGTTGGAGGGAATGGSGGATGTGGASKTDSSGCAVGGAGAGLGPWLLAGGFAATIWFARRRRR